MDVSRLFSGTTFTPQASGDYVSDVRAKIQQSGTNMDQAQVDRVQVESMVEGLNDFLQPINRTIRFELHDKLDRYYVKVVDRFTDEVIREVPPEQMLDIYAAMAEFMGLIVDERI
ncbi:flagellar protein FlaG [Amphibacillus marinus]|uniref:Flagellar protein FlaG n=1 Tax=Amphibacillus marinus TaxID=872970 RepID=A0A1H8QDA6_9BACI|nr:flagellar protein FlaG [Amphibacillus marinus]SEO52219.1 flagellar protein FlaG [Amphibacillus marinus]